MTARSAPMDRPALPAYGGMAFGALLMGSVFLPWYTLNIAPPFSADSVSGWNASGFAKAALALAAVVVLASAVQMLDGRDVVRLERTQRVALAWASVVAAVSAAVMVGIRLVILPDPAEFFSRQIGLYVATVAAVGAVLAALGQIATQD